MNTYSPHKKTIEVTLRITAYEDFNPAEYNFAELLELEGDEECEVYVRDIYDDVEQFMWYIIMH